MRFSRASVSLITTLTLLGHEVGYTHECFGSNRSSVFHNILTPLGCMLGYTHEYFGSKRSSVFNNIRTSLGYKYWLHTRVVWI